MKKINVKLSKLNLNKQIITNLSNITGGEDVTVLTNCYCQSAQGSNCSTLRCPSLVGCNPQPVSNNCGSYDLVCGATLTTCESNGCPITK